MEIPAGKVDERMENMEAGLATPLGAFKCSGEVILTVRSLRGGDEETETTLQSDQDIKMRGDGAEPRDARRLELAVAATAAVELSNLFFLLRGEPEPHRRRGNEIASVTATEGLAVLAAFAAFLSAFGLLLARHTAGGGGGGKGAIVPVASRRVILFASSASLFLSSVATAVSLLRARGLTGLRPRSAAR